MSKRPQWWQRLNSALMPHIGPPPLGPYNEEPLPPTGAKACPLCGKSMDEHTFSRGVSGDGRSATRMHCPA
ncbi:MAG TPA: hypothetical protein VGP24_14015 [Glaciihabitans sp.]|jgi:hypothetical protein|nr:hypothetical protein [Glaciihabitans sp.]